ncbi:MAG TPA: hypothetical protein VM100_08745 [Longimicrobiales bacterium]|nr:hypothetical protein [Longimicrobiales bacterium]
MNAPPILDALARVERLLFETPVLESFIARREAGESGSEDIETADALALELIAHQSDNGSWGDSLALTAESLLLLADLQPLNEDLSAAVGRAIAWLRSRQRAPGAFAQNCSPARHEIGLCIHRATGFYSPGPASVAFHSVPLANGALFPSDDDARLALSALALRALLRFDAPRTDDRLQLHALSAAADAMFRDSSPVSAAAGIFVLDALIESRVEEATIGNSLSRLVGLQRADGTWGSADTFHVADTLLFAHSRGYELPALSRALTRTAEMLALSQHADGTWGNASGTFRLLVGWRILRHAGAYAVKVPA